MRRVIAFSLSFLLTGCKVGPDYHTPVTFVPEIYVEDKPLVTTELSDEDFFKWWVDTFNDPLLDQLLEEALYKNFDLRIATERIFQARANYWVQFASILPEFDSDFSATRYRTSESFVTAPVLPGISPIRNFFQLGIDAVWQIDLFGQLRRTADSAFDEWQATIDDRRGVKITILSEVASTYMSVRYNQEQIEFQKQLVEFDETTNSLFTSLLNSGLGDEQNVVIASSQIETDKATLELYRISLKQNLYALATLLGRLPEDILCDFSEFGEIPRASGKIPATLPPDLLRRRPDIAAAERRLAEQTELIGVAVADLFPQVSLVGSSSSFAANPLQGANIGFSSDHFNKLISHPSLIWGIGALVTWPIFDFGKRFAMVDIQKILRNQAYLTYEKTVVTAFQEVETALSTYFKDEMRLDHYESSVGLDKRNLDLETSRFQAGLVDYNLVIVAKERWLASVNLLLDTRRAVNADLIAIYTAFGGDW